MVRSVENLAKRKATGGRRIPSRGRRAYERDGFAAETLTGTTRHYEGRVRGGSSKLGLRAAEFANVVDPTSRKTVKAKISKVSRNPASRDYERRGVLTKGATIETELGPAKVTSRPGQDGVVNALLIK